MLNGSAETATALRESISEQVRELPLSVNLVARERELIDAVLNGSWWADCDDAALRNLSSRLAPLMRFRQPRLGGAMVLLNLADLTAVRDRIVAGPDGRDLPVAQYRQKVEETIRTMVEANPLLQRLQNGEALSDGDLRALADLLRLQDPAIDEERLRQVYDVRTASLVQLLRHVLGVAPLERWSTRVTREFEEFIATHTTYSSLQRSASCRRSGPSCCSGGAWSGRIWSIRRSPGFIPTGSGESSPPGRSRKFSGLRGR